jgi:hypothetical protein
MISLTFFFVVVCLFVLQYQDLVLGSTPGTTPLALFLLGIFEIGSNELFALAGFEP